MLLFKNMAIYRQSKTAKGKIIIAFVFAPFNKFVARFIDLCAHLLHSEDSAFIRRQTISSEAVYT